MKLTRTAITLPAVLWLLSITGCTTPTAIPISKDRIASIKSITINQNVPKPKEILFRGALQNWSVLLGPIGAAATAGAGLDAGAQMVDFMGKNQIDISEIVLTEFQNEIKDKPFPIVVGTNKSDAEFKLRVDMYGFNKTHPLGSNMNPLIRVTGSLVSASGDVLWQESEYVTDFASDNDQGQSLETYYKEPAKLRRALQCVAKVAVSRIMGTLNKI